jgi:PAS domain-containing protein
MPHPLKMFVPIPGGMEAKRSSGSEAWPRQGEALLADADLHRMALAAAGAGAWLWDAGTNRQSWSPEIYAIYGLAPEEGPLDLESWLGRCVHVEDRARFSHALRRVAADGGGEFEVEYRCTHPALGLRWVRSNGKVICDERGRAARAYGLSRDVTEHQRAEQALRESEERLRMALAAGDIAVWDWDIASGRVSWAEDGRTRDDGRHALPTTIEGLRASVHPADRQKVGLAIERALASRAQYGVEFRLVGPDGGVRWSSARGTVVRDHAGRPVRMIGIIRDISARKAAEERQAWLMAELDDRARSLLALVQSEVQKTPAGTPGAVGAPAASPGLDHRAPPGEAVEATSVAQVVAQVVAQAVAPDAADRISVSGRLVALSPRAAEALGVALDELAVSSAKCGALSGAEGVIAIEWSLLDEGEPLLDLSWAEDNRGAGASPNRPDLARRLLRSRIVADFGGRVNLSFPAKGLRAALRMPLARVAATVRP